MDLSAAGFYDYLDMGAVVAAEWSENCADLLALENPIYINIDRLDETTHPHKPEDYHHPAWGLTPRPFGKEELTPNEHSCH